MIDHSPKADAFPVTPIINGDQAPGVPVGAVQSEAVGVAATADVSAIGNVATNHFVTPPAEGTSAHKNRFLTPRKLIATGIVAVTGAVAAVVGVVTHHDKTPESRPAAVGSAAAGEQPSAQPSAQPAESQAPRYGSEANPITKSTLPSSSKGYTNILDLPAPGQTYLVKEKGVDSLIYTSQLPTICDPNEVSAQICAIGVLQDLASELRSGDNTVAADILSRMTDDPDVAETIRGMRDNTQARRMDHKYLTSSFQFANGMPPQFAYDTDANNNTSVTLTNADDETLRLFHYTGLTPIDQTGQVGPQYPSDYQTVQELSFSLVKGDDGTYTLSQFNILLGDPVPLQ